MSQHYFLNVSEKLLLIINDVLPRLFARNNISNFRRSKITINFLISSPLFNNSALHCTHPCKSVRATRRTKSGDKSLPHPIFIIIFDKIFVFYDKIFHNVMLSIM